MLTLGSHDPAPTSGLEPQSLDPGEGRHRCNVLRGLPVHFDGNSPCGLGRSAVWSKYTKQLLVGALGHGRGRNG